MQSNERVRKWINEAFPHFLIHEIKNVGFGDNSNAYLINSCYLFRFAKREEVKYAFKKEVIVLPQIADKLWLPIPEFGFISQDLNFIGHKVLRGMPLSSGLYSQLNGTIQKSIQKDITTFLTELHSIDFKAISDAPLEIMDYQREYSDDLGYAKKQIFPHISASSQSRILRYFDEYFSDEYFLYTPALIHNDFSSNHILFDNKTNRITGIIDFGDMAIGDPDYDFMYLSDAFGSPFIEGIMQVYNIEPVNYFRKKIRFFSLFNKIQILNDLF